ncbi:MAG: hypothetical protein EPN97_07515 [Alphaproteobacteria bacterium]|nr:MAG: hypothetical protein EPN97_07515 [Alphaproteobacteria bacterium]
MFDEAPKSYDDPVEWFRYFRMTKYLPGMQMKFEDQMKRADTAYAALRVMTSYASAALDVVFFCGMQENKMLARELEETFGLRPAHMILLSVDEIAKPMKVTPHELTERLKTGGFRISGSGIITGFDRPPEARRPQPNPAGPSF